MRIEYLARAADDTLICVATETDLYSARIFIGKVSSPLREVRVDVSGHPIMRLRDGGTTIIPTVEGTFTVPSPLRNSEWKSDVRFGDQRFELVDHSNAGVELSGRSLRVHGLPADLRGA
jgi:hypothetical protein